MTSAEIKAERLGLDARCVLVEMPVVRALTGWRRDEIYNRVEGADLLHAPLIWVWNVAAGASEVRDLRFWRREIEYLAVWPRGGTPKKIGEVVNEILPAARKHFHSGEVLQMFALSRPALQRLRGELGGRLHGARNCFFDRSALAEFLKRRWLGHLAVRPPKNERN